MHSGKGLVCGRHTRAGFSSPEILTCSAVCDARRDTTLKLNRKVEDLEDVRYVMGVMKEVSGWQTGH